MKVKNIAKHNYCHAKLDKNYKLELLVLVPNEVKDVPDEIAKSWIKTGEVIEYIEPKDMKKIEKENEKLKQELEKFKQSTECAECYENDKVPALEDCDKCENKEVKTKTTNKKSAQKKDK